MTKKEMKERARNIRSHMARFVDLQDPRLVEVLFTGTDMSPEYAALNRLLMARTELNHLIEALRREGYGQEVTSDAG